MSLAMDMLREQWRDAYRRYDANMKIVTHPLTAGFDNLFYASAKLAREHMRKTAAEIVRLKKLEAEHARYKAALEEIASYVEPHWFGAGLPLDTKWIVDELFHWNTLYDEVADERDALEARVAELETEHVALKAQLANCTQFESPSWVNPAFEELRARNWQRINDPRNK